MNYNQCILFLLQCFLITSIGIAQDQTQSNTEDKCYETCNYSSQYGTTTLHISLRSDNTEQLRNLGVSQIIDTTEVNQKWVKKKADRCCFGDGCLVWTLVEVVESIDTHYIIQDKDQFTTVYLANPSIFKFTETQKVLNSKDSVSSERKQIICDSNINYAKIVRLVKAKLNQRGYDTGNQNNLIKTQSTLTEYQMANQLPLCGLNLETLTHLGISTKGDPIPIQPPPTKICTYSNSADLKKGNKINIEEGEEIKNQYDCYCPSNDNISNIELQVELALEQKGYLIDNVFGNLSKRSLAQFQIKHNRPIGVLDLGTLDLLRIKYKQ